ncbi:lysophospholipid acyltransferase family protein [Pseudonocardia sp.]|uniref:lysophospholipid acyltransferase family protein n=1 Tax=Pseudonocardia sp. TaxID=60912 RepID=UPI002622E442|nr:lysophospholipid acyltransferase family protein [Pseudonocardia sp.]
MSGHPCAPAGAWVPVPVCGPQCLPVPADGLRTGPVRFALRLGSLVAVLAVTLVGVALLRGRAQQRWVRAAAARSLRAAGVQLHTAGPLHDGPGGALVVANHLSWIDVLALHAAGPIRMQAKREVAAWPVIGGLAARIGTLFVDRTGLRDLPRTVAATADALRAGAVVGVFPEGTTWCGAAAGTFRRAGFQAAIDARVPVRPVALVLRLPDGTATPAGAFVGDQTLWDSLCRVLSQPGLVCELTVLPAIGPDAGDRRELATATAAAVSGVTGVAHPVVAAHRPVPHPEPVAA